MGAAELTKTKHKVYTYKTNTSWTEGKSGTLSAEGKPMLKITSPPEFRGEPGMWTPEDMFVGAVEVCHMATFLAFAARKQIPITSYRSHANGVHADRHIPDDRRGELDVRNRRPCHTA
jgi:organic hydroperoxide reductase OsmC/OhrA